LLMQFVVTRDGTTRAGWQILGLHRLGLRTWGFAILARQKAATCLHARYAPRHGGQGCSICCRAACDRSR
jgi:hypothetical protein